MPREANSEEVIDLPLVPIGCDPEVGDGGNGGIIPIRLNPDTQTMLVGEGLEMIDHFHAVLIVDSRHVHQIIEGEVFILPKQPGHIAPLFAFDDDRRKVTIGAVDVGLFDGLFSHLFRDPIHKGVEERLLRRGFRGFFHLLLPCGSPRPLRRGSGRRFFGLLLPRGIGRPRILFLRRLLLFRIPLPGGRFLLLGFSRCGLRLFHGLVLFGRLFFGGFAVFLAILGIRHEPVTFFPVFAS